MIPEWHLAPFINGYGLYPFAPLGLYQCASDSPRIQYLDAPVLYLSVSIFLLGDPCRIVVHVLSFCQEAPSSRGGLSDVNDGALNFAWIYLLLSYLAHRLSWTHLTLYNTHSWVYNSFIWHFLAYSPQTDFYSSLTQNSWITGVNLPPPIRIQMGCPAFSETF